MNPPTGTRDFDPSDVLMRDHVKTILQKHFQLYGGQPMETPVLEKMKLVKDLYGEHFNKEVYKLDTESGEPLLLRYDLTLSLAHYAAKRALQQFRRYQIGKVYRKDIPQISKGRYREFYQADFDIIGTDYDQMAHETEILFLTHDILQDLLGKNTFRIRINDRELLSTILTTTFNVPKTLFPTVCSTLDKISKKSKKELGNELHSKGLTPNVTEKVLNFIFQSQALKNSNDVLSFLREGSYAPECLIVKMETFLKNANIDRDTFVLDLSLARGLDYYTGLIYEAEYKNSEMMSSSIAAGGRYDTMIESMGNIKHVPAIGISFGIERLVTILEQHSTFKKKSIVPHVFVASIGKNMTFERIKVCSELRQRHLIPEMLYTKNPKMRSQLNQVFDRIQWMIVFGERELKAGTLKLKNIHLKTEIEMKRNEIMDVLEQKCLTK
jgi:histidyl-tRNA synthetase